MNEEMKQALLECCERNCEVISPAVVAFAKDLINTVIETSENKIDDLFLPIINTGIFILGVVLFFMPIYGSFINLIKLVLTFNF